MSRATEALAAGRVIDLTDTAVERETRARVLRKRADLKIVAEAKVLLRAGAPADAIVDYVRERCEATQ